VCTGILDARTGFRNCKIVKNAPRCIYSALFIFLQRGLSGIKLKHAPFRMKGATAHTSLHQIGPNLASN